MAHSQLPMKEVLSQLTEEVQAIVTERIKNAKEEGLRMYWEIGQTLRKYESEGFTISDAVRGLKHMTSETSLWFAVKLFDTYPSFEKVYDTPEGLSTSVEKQKKLLGFRGAEKSKETTCKKCPVHCHEEN